MQKLLGQLINVQIYPKYLLRGVQKVFPTYIGIGTCLLGIKLMFVKFEPQRYCGFPLFLKYLLNSNALEAPSLGVYQLLDQSFTNQSRVDLKKHFICLSIHFPSFICHQDSDTETVSVIPFNTLPFYNA